jgi:putative transposase
MYIPGLPYHVIQRGNNRAACYFNVEDYQFYLALLLELSQRFGVAIHAYVLMTNHIHLLATPEEKDSLSRMMGVVGSRYAQYINKKYRRTGSLWEGRHKSSPVDSERYLLKCYRYIELNPVAAHMVKRPEEYGWSSYAANAWGHDSEVITPHAEYLRLGNEGALRQYAYRELFKISLSEEDLHGIQKAAYSCLPLGSDRFREQIEQELGSTMGYMKRGRPRVVKI